MIDPRVSVLMPALNAERYISSAIESILGQTFTDFELIVIDDGSTDRTGEIAGCFAKHDSRVSLVTFDQNRGIASALNEGIDVARGQYIARMDADDWSFPCRLERQIDFLDDNKDVDLCGSAIEVCDSDMNPINLRTYPRTDAEIRRRLFRYSPFAHPAIVYRTGAARAVGGYNTALSPADDYDFYLRLGTVGHFANLPDVLHRWRTSRMSSSQANGRRTERLTSYIQCKAAVEYGYKMAVGDVAYMALQYASSFVIPSRVKFWVFNHFRARVTH